MTERGSHLKMYLAEYADLREVISRVAERHNVWLRPDDPVFAVFTVLEVMNDRLAKRIEKMLEAAKTEIAAGSDQQINLARAISRETIKESADHVANVIRGVADDEIRRMKMRSEAAAEEINFLRSSGWAAAMVAGASAAAVFIFALVRWRYSV
jgi:CHASE3 domain sensor protein